jgi:hypothetical protein
MFLQDCLLAILDPWLDRIALSYCDKRWILYFKKSLRCDYNLLFGATGSTSELRCTSQVSFLLKVTNVKVASLEFVEFVDNLWKFHQSNGLKKKSGNMRSNQAPLPVILNLFPALPRVLPVSVIVLDQRSPVNRIIDGLYTIRLEAQKSLFMTTLCLSLVQIWCSRQLRS